MLRYWDKYGYLRPIADRYTSLDGLSIMLGVTGPQTGADQNSAPITGE